MVRHNLEKNTGMGKILTRLELLLLSAETFHAGQGELLAPYTHNKKG